MKNLRIGIDPAFRKDGFCVCVIDETGDVDFRTFKNGFFDFMRWAETLPKKVLICIENSNLQKTGFDKRGGAGVVSRKGRNVGANQAASQYTVDFCRFLFGNRVKEVSPKQKGAKWKSDNIVFAIAAQNKHKIRKKRLSQDDRDAYKLALLNQ